MRLRLKSILDNVLSIYLKYLTYFYSILASTRGPLYTLLDTEEPVHCFKSKEKGKLYLVSRHQLEVLEKLQLPFEEIPENAKTSATGG